MKTERVISKFALLMAILSAPLVYNKGWEGAITEFIFIGAAVTFVLFDSKEK